MNAILEQIFQVGFLAAIIRIATPLTLATLGEMISERSGVLNLGIEGIMLISAMTGFMGAYYGGNLWIGILVAALTGAAFAALHAILTVMLGVSQHVCGIGITLLCTGLAYFFFRLSFTDPLTRRPSSPSRRFPFPICPTFPFWGPRCSTSSPSPI